MGGGTSKNKKYIVSKTFHPARVMSKELESWDDLPAVPSTPGGSDLDRDFLSWDFDIWLVGEEELLPLSMHVITQFSFYKTYNISTETWCKFIWEVQKLMGVHTNPYHNYRHIMDVTQSCACIVNEFSASVWMSELDTFSLIMSAIVHDLEHPGTNNAYQVNASTPLAIRYNDISVLENHHCAKAFELWGQTELNVTANLDETMKRAFRKNIIALVLNTDMTQHFSLRAELDSVVKRNITDAPPRKADEPLPKLVDKDLLVVMKSILHTADISNPAKQWEASKKWSDLVIEEFFLQGDREKKEGFAVSMNCDRDSVKQDELSMNFADFIVVPFFFSMTALLPKMIKACRNLGTNRGKWNQLYVERASAQKDDDPAIQEAMDKWAARDVAFGEKLATMEASIDPSYAATSTASETST
mmetsp:Transcript_7516/g.12494  ORF Transcript_7516/g.12494 Transcript_7516/m.12494 type:complete len:416 (+) Transcript_7516:77-1324(+)